MDSMEVQEYYNIGKNDEVVIYGAGALGKEMALKLQCKWNIVALFDQNANNIVSDTSIPIYTLEEGIDLLGSQIVVIICIHNAQMHPYIADEVRAKGVNKIFFAPVGRRFVTKNKMRMLKLYESLFERGIEKIRGIPYYDKLLIDRWSKCTIHETNDYIVAWCNIEILYVNCEMLESEKEKIVKDKYADLPIAAYRMMVDAYKYFQDGVSLIGEFVSDYRLRESTNHDTKEFLQRRYEVYQMLENEWKTNQEYFKYAPVDVKWNKNGYFNITDGHNRAVYLHLKGLNWIPVRMCRADYLSWENSVVANKVIQELAQGKVDLFVTSVPHPYFMYEKVQKEVNGLEVLSAFQYYLGVEIRNIKTVLEISSYEGYFSRNFIRSGAQTAVVIESDAMVKKRISEIQNLLQLRQMLIKDGLADCDSDMSIDVAFIVSSMESGELRYGLQNTVLKNSKVIMWESYINPDEEKQAILDSGYATYVRLLNKCYGDRVSEVGVFVR